jgi:DNA-binding transcriptional LysR family regulator
LELELNQLRVFLEAVRAESYTLAGSRLHISQSAVSHAVRKLERGLDRRLVDWRGRRFSLTEDGRQLFELCGRVFAELEEGKRRLASTGQGIRWRVVLGATVEFGTTVLIRKMGPFFEAHPEIHVDFVFSHHLVQPLLDDEVDLAVDCQVHRHPAVQRTALFREKYVVVASPGFLARNPIREPLDLATLPTLTMDGEPEWWHRMLRVLPEGRRPAFQRIVSINHVRGIANAALAGLGVGLVPKYTVLRDLRDGTLVELFPRLALLEDLFCIYQKRSRAAREVNRLLTEFLLELDSREYGDSIGAVDRTDEARRPRARVGRGRGGPEWPKRSRLS